MSIDQEAAPVAASVPVDTFGRRLKIARDHAGDISIAEACRRCGSDFKPATWSTWERGVAHPPHLNAICVQIARGLGVPAEWLYRGGPLTPEIRTRGLFHQAA